MIVSLLTDYGQDDEFAGICHAVIRGIAPDAAIVDLTHGIPRYQVRQGAIVLRNSLPYVPKGVHVAIVDPQVGTERRGLAVRTGDGRILVGPDNGLLSLAWEACDGIVEALDITRSRHRLEPVSATFHGRDIFAPVAAHLAAGAELAEAGQHVEPDELQTIELPRPEVREGEVVAHALLADRFGNVSLDVRHADLAGEDGSQAPMGLTLGGSVEIEAGGERFIATYAQTFADVRRGDVVLYEDAHRSLAIAINRGDAAATLQLGPDSRVILRPR
jgi:S-adenosylmethionine hydrolase